MEGREPEIEKVAWNIIQICDVLQKGTIMRLEQFYELINMRKQESRENHNQIICSQSCLTGENGGYVLD